MPSFTVTLYGLFLGNQDTTTGWYRKGFVYQSITMAIIPRGSTQALMSVGKICRLDAVGLTNYEVQEGDVVGDVHGNYWIIEGKKPFTWGDTFVYYECDLKKLLNFPFTAGFFGFEIIIGEIGSVTSGFEDGFERGYWAL